MDFGDWATWVGSAAALVAAVASVAAWRQGRPSVEWEFQGAKTGRSLVLNKGAAEARQVHVRTGSASDASNVESEVRTETVAPGEGVRILSAPTHASRADYAVVVTWTGRWGKNERWTHLPH